MGASLCGSPRRVHGKGKGSPQGLPFLRLELSSSRTLLALGRLPVLLAGLFKCTPRFAVIRILHLGGILARHANHRMRSGLSGSDLNRKSRDETNRDRGKKQFLEHGDFSKLVGGHFPSTPNKLENEAIVGLFCVPNRVPRGLID